MWAHPNLIMLALTTICSIVMYTGFDYKVDMLNDNLNPYLRFIIPGLLITDSISIFKKSIVRKIGTIFW